MIARWSFKLACLLLAAVLAATTTTISAPIGKKKSTAAEEIVTPAIDLAKLASDAKLRAAADRNLKASVNNLKALGVALHNYACDNEAKLRDDILDKEGKPILSWRVRLLPYLGGARDFLAPPDTDRPAQHAALYKQFKLNEPWDSKHNLALLAKMPDVFASPRVKVKRKGYTAYQIFSGPDAVFNAGKTDYKINTIPDGTSYTLFAVETSKAVPWTKPADIQFDKDKKLPDFGKAYGNRPLGAMLDGSVRVLDLNKILPKTLTTAIMPCDGEVLGKDWQE